MDPIVIRTRVESDTLVLPALKGLVGRTVAIAIVPADPADPLDDLIDHECRAQCAAELAADPGPVPTLEEVRAITAKLPGSLSAQVIADREERV